MLAQGPRLSSDGVSGTKSAKFAAGPEQVQPLLAALGLCCVTLGKVLNLSLPQFLLLKIKVVTLPSEGCIRIKQDGSWHITDAQEMVDP